MPAYAVACVAALAGCGGTRSQMPVPVYAPEAQSWMRPEKVKQGTLVYAIGPASANSVGVYSYANGEQTGSLPVVLPSGMCVDASGNVYITTFTGTAFEYAHGGTSPLHEYNTSGEQLGCAVDAKNDVAITGFEPTLITVFARGDPAKGTNYSTPCADVAPMGYDNRANLVGIGMLETGEVAICAILRGAKSATILSTQGITIAFPGSTMWDGKYFALTDQESGGGKVEAIIRASLSGSSLIAHGETILTDRCFSDYVDIVSPFIAGKKNTPVNRHLGRVVVGDNAYCNGGGKSGIEFWRYPRGGKPFKSFKANVSGAMAVSIGD